MVVVMLLLGLPAGKTAATRLAVTVDDLPVMGPDVPGVERLTIATTLLDAFRRHGVPEAYGFVNAIALEWRPENVAILEDWVKAGHPLGNHTYAHKDLGQVTVEAYEADIVRDEDVLQRLSPATFHVFRFPYLQEGESAAKRAALRSWLTSRGYRTAQVTVDFEDWAWNEPYARCVNAGNAAGITTLEALYLEQALKKLRRAEIQAAKLGHAGMPQVLLLHVGAFDARMIDRLLATYAHRDVTFVPLGDALADPVYAVDPGYVSAVGVPFLDQLRSKGRRVATTAPPHPNRDVLATICR
jgi:peptidoglycan/xylan/chitin deacetylase (PgdA/CDA1 family)